MKKALSNLSVLLVFFNRPETLKFVFEKVKEARPARLFLACDGPRNEQDVSQINECKKIVEDIDWECDVSRKYNDNNLGCGMGVCSAITWAFQSVDQLVILEDDCVPTPSFFTYMEELLERYKDDDRICLISGLNHFKKWNCGGNSYFFARNGSAIWGWGTWKRVWDENDYYLNALNDSYLCSNVKKGLLKYESRKGNVLWRSWLDLKRKLNAGVKISAWDVQFGFLKHANERVGIVPSVNLIYNIGIGEKSTHAKTLYVRRWRPGIASYIPTTEMSFPMIHPKYVTRDYAYEDLFLKYFRNSPFWIVRTTKRILRFLGRLYGKSLDHLMK